MSRALVAVALLASSYAPPLRAQDPQQLALRQPIEREIAGAATHSYTLTLRPGQIARVVVEQKGVDLALSVFAPNGSKLFDVDSPNGSQGDEPATIAASESGAYRVAIRPLNAAGKGRYAVRLDTYLTESEYLSERLAGIGRVWGAVKFFHPFLAHKDIDWDRALVDAIPRVKTARSPQQYADAFNVMFDALQDPATRAIVLNIEFSDSRAAAASPGTKDPLYFSVREGFVVLHMTDFAAALARNDSAWVKKRLEMLAEGGKASGVILDCRYGDTSLLTAPDFAFTAALNNLLASWVEGVVPLGTERYRQHNGYPPQQGTTSGAYSSSLVIRTPGAVVGQAKIRKPIAILTDDNTPNQSALWSGLQTGGATIIHVGKNNTGNLQPGRTVPSIDGVRVTLRVTEFMHPAGGSTFEPDVRLTAQESSESSALDAAIASLKSPANRRVTPGATQAVAAKSGRDDPYPNMAFPPEEYRLLALFRFWSVINYFFPYKHLTDKPWDAVLADFIPRFIENKTALDYQRTVAELVARLQDSHGFVNGLRALEDDLGLFAPPLRLVSAGGKLAVAEIIDRAAADAAGIKVGDVIVEIDGQPAAERVTALASFRALSTPQAAYAYIYPVALRGARDSVARLRVEGIDARSRDVSIARTVGIATVSAMAPRKTPVYQVLPSGYGYIDLARLRREDADTAMDAVLNTPGLIFDMRGYPNGTAWVIAPRLTEKKEVVAALFRRRLQTGVDFNDQGLLGGQAISFEQRIPPNNNLRVYKGKVMMLINEFAISQSEHTCLFFKAATDVTFVGSTTNGANGDVTNMALPGNILVGFTGQEVRHADGHQLQRVGIQPHIKVEPTPAGVAEGRDEVLDAALTHLNTTLKRSSANVAQ